MFDTSEIYINDRKRFSCISIFVNEKISKYLEGLLLQVVRSIDFNIDITAKGKSLIIDSPSKELTVTAVEYVNKALTDPKIIEKLKIFL